MAYSRRPISYPIRDAALAALLYADAMQRRPNDYPLSPKFLWNKACEQLDSPIVDALPGVYPGYFRQLQDLMNQEMAGDCPGVSVLRIYELAMDVLHGFAYCHPIDSMTEMQKMIFEHLDGKACTTDDLEGALNTSRATLYGKKGKGALSELTNWGLVINDQRRGGYYRPDKPPRPE